MTGPLLFLLYAFPCAKGKLLAGRITKEECEALERCICALIEPPIELLERCFPDAVRALIVYAKTVQKNNIWAFGVVSRYWRYHHGHEGECAVTIGTVCGFTSNGDVQIVCQSRTLVAFNPYKLKLEIGDDVSVHRRTVVEKLD